MEIKLLWVDKIASARPKTYSYRFILQSQAIGAITSAERSEKEIVYQPAYYVDTVDARFSLIIFTSANCFYLFISEITRQNSHYTVFSFS